jgi:tetratricopeptide (TPR) repeat protein
MQVAVHDDQLLLSCWHQQIVITRHLAQFQRSIEMHELDQKVASSTNRRLLIGTNCHLGKCYEKLGQHEREINVYSEAHWIIDEPIDLLFHTQDDPAGKRIIYNGLGNSFYSLGQDPRAIKFYEKNQQLSRDWVSLCGLGDCSAWW